MSDRLLSSLHDILNDTKTAALAVSGGVDSMLLAYLATQFTSNHFTVFHAVSPAVSKEATRVFLMFTLKCRKQEMQTELEMGFDRRLQDETTLKGH